MTKYLELVSKLSEVEMKIKQLQKKRDELRDEAVTKGWAEWKFTIRKTAPSLAWWKKHRPATWEKYATETEVRKLVFKDLT